MSLPTIDALVVDWTGGEPDQATRDAFEDAAVDWRIRAVEPHRGFFRILFRPLARAARAVGEAFARLHRIVRAMGEAARAGLIWAIERVAPGPVRGPQDFRWPLARIGLSAPFPSAAGIRIAHLDTGYARHAEIEGALDMRLASDLVDGLLPPDADGTSLLGRMFENHGTRTSALLASRGGGRLRGAAGDATIIPLRVTQDPILWTDLEYDRVAEGIDAARAQRADVISMSLGGLWAHAGLDAALDRAADAGIIVVAAAGQPMRRVTYPGAHPRVITAAAVDHTGAPPAWSARGPEVDVAAPGEDVWVPKLPGEQGVERSWGTSYATVLTAGAAALWRAEHGSALARHPAADVGAAFARALRAAGFDPVKSVRPADFGAGQLDVQRLLAVAPSPPPPGESRRLRSSNIGAHDPAIHAVIRSVDRNRQLRASLRSEAASWALAVAARPATPGAIGALLAQELAFFQAFEPSTRSLQALAVARLHPRLSKGVALAYGVREGVPRGIPGASPELNAWLTSPG